MNKTRKLTSRQRSTYELIKKNTENGYLTTLKQIVNNYPLDDHSNGYEWREKTAGNHDNCSNVWKDINAINRSFQIEKSILFDDQGNFWIARNIDEVKKYVEKRYRKRAMVLLARASIMLFKARQNDQGKLLSVNDKPIDKRSRAREFVEGFINSADFSYEMEEALEEYLAS